MESGPEGRLAKLDYLNAVMRFMKLRTCHRRREAPSLPQIHSRIAYSMLYVWKKTPKGEEKA